MYASAPTSCNILDNDFFLYQVTCSMIEPSLILSTKQARSPHSNKKEKIICQMCIREHVHELATLRSNYSQLVQSNLNPHRTS